MYFCALAVRLSSGPVGVTSVVDVQDVDGALRVVDGVADAIFTTPGSPLSLEGLPQRSADSPRLLAERAANELQARRGGGFGEPFGELASRSRGDLDLPGQGRRFPNRSSRDRVTSATDKPSPRAISSRDRAMRSCAAGSDSSSSVASMESRSSAAMRTTYSRPFLVI